MWYGGYNIVGKGQTCLFQPGFPYPVDNFMLFPAASAPAETTSSGRPKQPSQVSFFWPEGFLLF